MEDKKSHEHKTVALSTEDLFAEGDASVSTTTLKMEVETETASTIDSDDDDDDVEDGEDINVKEADNCYDDQEERGNDDNEEEEEEEEDDEVEGVEEDCSSTSIDDAVGDSWRSDQHSSNCNRDGKLTVCV